LPLGRDLSGEKKKESRAVEESSPRSSRLGKVKGGGSEVRIFRIYKGISEISRWRWGGGKGRFPCRKDRKVP